MLGVFSKGVDPTPGDYSLPDVLERIYYNQLALEAAITSMSRGVELTFK